MINFAGFNYDFWMVGQVIIALVLFKKYKGAIKKLSSLNTLVLSPIAPILALVLFTMSRIKNKDYFIGYVFLLPLALIVVVMKGMGATIIVFSIIITCVGYTVYEINRLEDETNVLIRVLKGCRPVAISLVIGYISKGMDNPISFIICCNIFSDYIVKMYSKVNKNKWTKNGYDSENGANYNILAGFMEAALIGPPSDLVGRSGPIVDGLADALCIINLLVNGSQRGSVTVVVTDWSTAIIFFSLVVFIYLYSNLEYIKEEDKVWPTIFSNVIPHISKLQLLVVTITLVYSYTLSSTGILEAGFLIGKVVLVTILCMFARIKVVTSVFFTANMLF